MEKTILFQDIGILTNSIAGEKMMILSILLSMIYYMRLETENLQGLMIGKLL
jgi:hypothetical protein